MQRTRGWSGVVIILTLAAGLSMARSNPLIDALNARDENRVQELSRNPVLLKAADNQGNTPLHYIAARCDGDFIEELISRGADPNRPNNRNRTPMHWAAHECDFDVVERMIFKGGDYRALDDNGESPLFVAATRCDPYFVYRFVRGAGIDISGDVKLSAHYGTLVAASRAGAMKTKSLLIGIPLLLLLAAVFFREFGTYMPRGLNIAVLVSAVGFVSGLGLLGGFLAGAIFISPFFFASGGDGWGSGTANPIIALFIGIITAVVCAVAGLPIAMRYRERFSTSRILYYSAPLLLCAVGLLAASRVSMEPFVFP